MAGRRRNRTPVEHIDDRELLERAARDDTDAVRELHRRSAPSAWGLALAITGDPASAAHAVTEGFATAVAALRAGELDIDATFRPHVLAATRTAALTTDTALIDHVDELLARGAHGDDEALADAARSFAELPEQSRSALWMADVVMLPDDQLEVPLGESTAETEQLVEGARASLHQHLQARLAEHVADDDCRLVTAQLSGLLSGELDDLAADAVQEHLAGCFECRGRRERLVSATDRLALLAPHPPAELERESVAGWRIAVGLASGNTGQVPVVTGEVPAVEAEPVVEAEDETDERPVAEDEPPAAPVAKSPHPRFRKVAETTAAAAAVEAIEAADDHKPSEAAATTTKRPPRKRALVAADAAAPAPAKEAAAQSDETETTGPQRVVAPVALSADAARFDVAEPPLERLLRGASEAGPIEASPARRRLVGAVAAGLIVVGSIAAATFHVSDQSVHTALGADRGATGQFATTTDPNASTTTLAPPVTLPPIIDPGSLPDAVSPAGSGPAAPSGTTPKTTPTTKPTPTTTTKPATTTTAPTTTVPATTTTARHCLQPTILGCLKWSS